MSKRLSYLRMMQNLKETSKEQPSPTGIAEDMNLRNLPGRSVAVAVVFSILFGGTHYA